MKTKKSLSLFLIFLNFITLLPNSTSAYFQKTQDQNTLNTATATATAYLQKFDNFTLYGPRIGEAFITGIKDASTACANTGDTQSCLQICSISLDAGTIIASPTVVTPQGVIALGSAQLIAGLCDTTNGIIYLIKGDKLSAGISFVGVISISGGAVAMKRGITLSNAEKKVIKDLTKVAPENCTHRLCAFGKCQGFAFDRSSDIANTPARRSLAGV